jgi:heme-degrading monooxygenase HmoA
MATVAAAAGLAERVAAQGRAAAPAAARQPIVLHCDLIVDPAREQEMLKHFASVFKPAASKFEGFIDLKMLKLRTTIQGAAPARVNYRFQLTYQTEELRQTWVNSAVHTQVWKGIDDTLLNKQNFPVLLFDSV